MIATWMLYATLLGALFALAALALEMVARFARVGRRGIWCAAVIATGAVPTTLAFRSEPPTSSRLVLPVSNARAAARNGPTTAHASSADNPRPSAAVAPSIALRRFDTPNVDRALLILWAIASLSVAAWWVRSTIAARRAKRSWSVDVVDGTRVLVADDVGPAVVGVVRPSIVVPRWALDLDAPARALMLRHESEHVAARDPLLIALATVLCVLMPWNALVWMQRSRLRLAIEMDCDTRVLRADARARDYASLLLAVGERLSRPTVFGSSFAERRSSLERRIDAMTAPRANRMRMRATGAVVLAALCVAIACEAPSPAGVRHASFVRAPASLYEPGGPPRQYFPAVSPLPPLTSAESTWIALALEKSYPTVLTGDDSFLSVSLVLDASGALVKTGAARKPADLKPDEQVVVTGIEGDPAGVTYGADVTGDVATSEAERRTTERELEALSQHNVVPEATRNVLPTHLRLDYTSPVTTLDPVVGVDPMAVRRVDNRVFVVKHTAFELHLVLLKPGRGSPADLDRRTLAQPNVRVTNVALSDTAAYIHEIDPQTLAAIRACKPPGCIAHITRGPDANEMGFDLDSTGSGGGIHSEDMFSVVDSIGGSTSTRGNWTLTQADWDTMTHKPVVLVDGVPSTFENVLNKLGPSGKVVGMDRLSPAAAMKLSNDPRAKNGAIVVTTSGR